MPPQIIKGIIERESSFSNGMRWEPFFQIKYSEKKKKLDDDYKHPTMSIGRYRIKSENNLGDPDIPSDHIFVNNGGNNFPNEYWGYQGTIWDLFYKNCKQVNPFAERDLYPDKGASKWPDKFSDGWNNEKKQAELVYKSNLKKAKELELISQDQYISFMEDADDYTRLVANYWAKNKFKDGIMNRIAQTRISTSYGLMQVLYTSATAYLHYPEEYYTDPMPQVPSYLPEYLNEKDKSLKYGSEGIAFYVKKEIEYKNDDKDNNWTAGFERTFIIGLYGYNHGFNKNSNKRYINKGYGYDVLKRAQKYLPEN